MRTVFTERNSYIAYKGTALLSISCMSELELLGYAESHATLVKLGYWINETSITILSKSWTQPSNKTKAQ